MLSGLSLRQNPRRCSNSVSAHSVSTRPLVPLLLPALLSGSKRRVARNGVCDNGSNPTRSRGRKAEGVATGAPDSHRPLCGICIRERHLVPGHGPRVARLSFPEVAVGVGAGFWKDGGCCWRWSVRGDIGVISCLGVCRYVRRAGACEGLGARACVTLSLFSHR